MTLQGEDAASLLPGHDGEPLDRGVIRRVRYDMYHNTSSLRLFLSYSHSCILPMVYIYSNPPFSDVLHLPLHCSHCIDAQVKAAVEEYYLNSLETECIEVTRELVHPNGMGEVLKVSD